MQDKHAVLAAIQAQGMLPLYYHDSEAVSIDVARTLYHAGIRAIEYTNRGPAALQNFTALQKAARQEFPDLALGVGTVKVAADAEAFVAAGADFIVAPIVNAQVAAVVNRAGLLWVPGCMTPTEISIAQEHHALLIKLFPADLLKPTFVSAIKELFPGQLFMPTGGIDLNKAALQEWFAAGVCAVGMGSKLISKPILQQRLYDDLYQQTVAALELVRAAKKGSGTMGI